MPLPKEPFTIHGGCNCKAIRYKLCVPPFSERPNTVYCTPGADMKDLRLPAVYQDHCNDCRRASGSIMPMWIVCIFSTVTFSVLPITATAEHAFEIDDRDRDWLSATNIFSSETPQPNPSYLAVYKSSPGRSRWFCSRCGVQVAYSIDEGIIPPEWGWPRMIDIPLGTVDRKDLEQDYMKPERALWCEKGILWVREMARNGAGGIPEHPLTKIDKVAGDDITEDLKALKALGK